MPFHGPKRNQYEKERRETLRAELLDMLGGKCVVCGTKDRLDFHHLDPKEKDYRIAMMLGWARERAILEAQKCELRCRFHHQEVHFRPITHATMAGYQRGCRCDQCREANRNRSRNWRARGLDKTRKNYIGSAPTRL